MTPLADERGFTFTEIMIAITIMALGFLAMAQMQFLSLRQKQLAEQGTNAANIIQFIADRDLEEVKRAHLLNSIAFVEAQAGRLNPGNDSDPHLQYCKTSNTDRVCDACPCNPLAKVTPDPGQALQTTCAVINVHDFDPKNVSFKSNVAQCSGGAGDSLIVVKRVASSTDNTTDPPETTLNVTYGIKTKNEFAETGLSSVSIKDTLATQDMVFSAHREDWSQFIPSWTNVMVPHVP
ncbi:MAG TPA: prepilin-type N-terminal cleavage/methylation domain-containing protein [Thermodesulfobacteriota bacterium]|nr:prepilin-type N-terminal cleavage/methylation domain-containing protein [Thermodesulfobacteriota bacterium]